MNEVVKTEIENVENFSPTGDFLWHKRITYTVQALKKNWL